MSVLNKVGLGYSIKTSLSFALGIGLCDIFLDHKIPDSVPGTGTSGDDGKHPVLTALGGHLRAHGSAWRGYALLLWWISRDAEHRTGLLKFLGAVMVFSGIGRAVAAIKFNVADPFVLSAVAMEVIGPVVMYPVLYPSK
jgi:hypothetical protein